MYTAWWVCYFPCLSYPLVGSVQSVLPNGFMVFELDCKAMRTEVYQTFSLFKIRVNCPQRKTWIRQIRSHNIWGILVSAVVSTSLCDTCYSFKLQTKYKTKSLNGSMWFTDTPLTLTVSMRRDHDIIMCKKLTQIFVRNWDFCGRPTFQTSTSQPHIAPLKMK